MLTDVVWSNQAREALLEIYVSVGLENPVAAEEIYDRVEALTRHLARYPRMGRRRPDLRTSLRMLVEAPYLILYETEPDSDDGPVATIEIVNVVDGRRDLAGELGRTFRRQQD